MIQFNLLPDVKLEYLKARRTKRLVFGVSFVLAGIALAVLLLLFSVVGLQKKHLSNLQADIDRDSATLREISDLDRILTVQSQLRSLPELHGNKPVATRLFGILKQITPTQATIGELSVDFDANTLIFVGEADKLESINKFVDTLKFTNYTTEEQTEPVAAFSGVVLTSFTRDEQNASYEINLNFDPVIFSSDASPKLTVPKIITTRSETAKPEALFKAPPPEAPGSN
jgi:hypothetical protein